jgi:biotin synthase
MAVLDKLEKGLPPRELTLADATELLGTDTRGAGFFRLLSLANALSRRKFRDRGYVFAQIGINAEPCSKNCAFCSLGAAHYAADSTWRKGVDAILAEARRLSAQGIDDLFLMTTADYPQDHFAEVAAAVKATLPPDVRLVANIGDFNAATARDLKAAGCTGAYHICRLNEGIDTGIAVPEREKTLEAIAQAGLELYYCVEPVGPEHSPEMLAREMLRAREYGVQAMAAMRRIPVPGTPLFGQGRISALELTRIAAVAGLVVDPARSMNVHEPVQMALLAGVNQLYAEAGANPRDTRSLTEKGRGLSPSGAWAMLAEGHWFPAG